MSAQPVKRIAMWSGPRNISTALMRSFENRPDCMVVDEPFYACYLHHTGLDHPGRQEVLESQPIDPDRVIKALMRPLPPGTRLQYQKQMTHHLPADAGHDWMAQIDHCFLLRDPRAMVASYVKTRPDVSFEDLGIAQMHELFCYLVDRTGKAPLVIDSDDLLAAPEPMLRALCARLGVSFLPEMLAWPAGPRPSDGVWAPWWYSKVEKSTGFEARPTFNGQLSEREEDIAERAAQLQEPLTQYKILL